ncbi:MAG: hypothetical protein EA403_02155 [Spirochaetaceae bacterium]|nr:MAG: hypothetical protein EA403_02155 [Spirochaetaceae bacterium]
MVACSTVLAVGWLLIGCSLPGGRDIPARSDLGDLLQSPGRRDLALALGEDAARYGRLADAEIFLQWALGDVPARLSTHGRGLHRRLSARQSVRARTLLAAVAMERGDYLQARTRAERAHRLADATQSSEQESQDGALLVLGRASVALADYPAAVAAFSRVGRPLDEPDLDALIVAFRGLGDYHAALGVIAERTARFGYAPGHGSEESLLHEWVGRPDRAVAAVLVEAEYLRYHHGRSRDATQRALSDLEGALLHDDPASIAARQLVAAYRAFLDQSWESASWLLVDLVDNIDHPFVTYLLLASRIRNPPVAVDLFHRYAELEPLFAGMQYYYSQLWRGLREAHRRGALPGYSVLTMRQLLERTILAAPASAEAYQARMELAVLVGLPPQDARILLLPAEIDQIIDAAIWLRDPHRLDPLVAALSMPDSPYLWAVLLGLQRIALIPAVRDYLVSAAVSVSPIAAERIDRLVGRER